MKDCVREDWRGGGSELGSHQDLWKILWIRIRQNDADPLGPDPQHCFIDISSPGTDTWFLDKLLNQCKFMLNMFVFVNFLSQEI